MRFKQTRVLQWEAESQSPVHYPRVVSPGANSHLHLLRCHSFRGICAWIIWQGRLGFHTKTLKQAWERAKFPWKKESAESVSLHDVCRDLVSSLMNDRQLRMATTLSTRQYEIIGIWRGKKKLVRNGWEVERARLLLFFARIILSGAKTSSTRGIPRGFLNCGDRERRCLLSSLQWIWSLHFTCSRLVRVARECVKWRDKHSHFELRSLWSRRGVIVWFCSLLSKWSH